jgi:hypothetical protein
MNVNFQDTFIRNNSALQDWRAFGKDGKDAERVGTTFDDTESVV